MNFNFQLSSDSAPGHSANYGAVNPGFTKEDAVSNLVGYYFLITVINHTTVELTAHSIANLS